MSEINGLVKFIIPILSGIVISIILAVLKVPSPTDFLIPIIPAIENTMPNAPAQVHTISDNLIMFVKFIGWFGMIEGLTSIVALIYVIANRNQ